MYFYIKRYIFLKSNYEIFNASAGSGKTFTLTSRYLVKLLGSSENESYKRILALTFTNKASEEMKNRILSSLNEFSKLIPLMLNIMVNKKRDKIKTISSEEEHTIRAHTQTHTK